MPEASTDAENIEHLRECPGCEHCGYLLEFYAGCDRCGQWGHKSVMYSDAGERTLCRACAVPVEE